MIFNTNSQKVSNIGISIWLSILTIMTFLIIIIGGLTRLTDSGLSMVDWRPIMGAIPPLNNNSWIEVFNNYKESPEFKIVNKLMTLEEFKYIFWWEWFHRFFARCIGIVFIFPFIYFLFYKKITKRLFITLSIVLLFGILQALVGWWMVKSGLVHNPYVSAYRLAFHLFNALIIFTLLFWSTMNSFTEVLVNQKNNIYNFLFNLNFLFLFLTIISGAFMAGTNAGNSFNSFPLMNGKIIPEGYYLEHLSWFNTFENTIAINFNHRWFASFTFIFIFVINFYFLISNKIKINNFSLILVLIFISLQFLLGILTLINNVPILLASMHQTNSIILLGSMLFAFHQYLYINSEEHEKNAR